MSLEPGRKLGRYEIVAQAGAGGMGEVYRAHDTRLDRTVAIKVLPEAVADNPSFQARFEREARAVSGLNHPRICALHDVGHEDGLHFLVMEYLEGETLAARIQRESLNLDQALDCAAQIAEALAAAHRAGVIHRDLKPGNVMLTAAGAKLLDFGLAKPLQDEVGGPSMTMAATATSPLTATGTVMGTFQYMAPEVLEGGEVDARSDIFAFGALLHEMITGRKAFEGKTQASVAAAILKEDTRPVSSFVSGTPPALDRLVRRCLSKNPDERWQSAADLADELRWIASGNAPAEETSPTGRPRGSSRLPWSVAGLLAIVAVLLGLLSLRQPASSPREAIRFEIPPPEGTLLRSMYESAAPVEVSPDGRHVVFGVFGAKGGNRLWLRSLDSEPRPLPGTEDGSRPFWSPDSRNIGFFTNDELRRVDIEGGPSITLCKVVAGRGGTWNEEGTIVLAAAGDAGLVRVPDGGGDPKAVTELGESPLETSHRYPRFLPDGRHFLYLALGSAGAKGAEAESELRLMLGSLDGDEARLLLRGASNAVYAAGHLVYRRGTALRARPFDPEGLEFTGEALTVADAVHYDAGYERAIFSASDRLLAYMGGNFTGQLQPKLLDRSGKVLRAIRGDASEYEPRFSPDGRSLAIRANDAKGEQIWIIDLERDVHTRLTFDEGFQGWPVWSPDGRRIAYGSTTGDTWNTLIRRVDGDGEPQVLASEGVDCYPLDWSPDGKYLVLGAWSDERGYDLWIVESEEGSEPRPLLDAPYNETLPAISPDGRWMAYTSEESGRPDVYVTRFPTPEGKWQVSGDGGLEPIWDPSGKALLYRGADHTMMEVPLTYEGSGLRLGSSRSLFNIYTSMDIDIRTADLSPDGTRFATSVISEEHMRTPITVVVDWAQALADSPN